MEELFKLKDKIKITGKTDLDSALANIFSAREATRLARIIKGGATTADSLFLDFGINRRNRVGSRVHIQTKILENLFINWIIDHGSESWFLTAFFFMSWDMYDPILEPGKLSSSIFALTRLNKNGNDKIYECKDFHELVFDSFCIMQDAFSVRFDEKFERECFGL